jgi:predicted DNA-binding WGR domain protein
LKVLQQKTLYFSEGRSDKVYEVDLCESGEDLYVVNFRYGRRGASLRESTKTIFPVTYQEAVKLFNSLVLSKEKKGYTEAVTEVQAVLEEEPQIEKEVNVAREATLLKYLEDGIAKIFFSNWLLCIHEIGNYLELS